MIKFCWVVSMAMSAIGALVAYTGIAAANGAPQAAAAAAAAKGLAVAVIPYCFSRALGEIRRRANGLSGMT